MIPLSVRTGTREDRDLSRPAVPAERAPPTPAGLIDTHPHLLHSSVIKAHRAAPDARRPSWRPAAPLVRTDDGDESVPDQDGLCDPAAGIHEHLDLCIDEVPLWFRRRNHPPPHPLLAAARMMRRMVAATRRQGSRCSRARMPARRCGLSLLRQGARPRDDHRHLRMPPWCLRISACSPLAPGRGRQGPGRPSWLPRIAERCGKWGATRTSRRSGLGRSCGPHFC